MEKLSRVEVFFKKLSSDKIEVAKKFGKIERNDLTIFTKKFTTNL